MANIQNPRKGFLFTITIAGMNPFLCQEVETPEVSSDTVIHGDANYEVKTAGMAKTGTLTLHKLSTANGPDNQMFDWIRQCQNDFLGGGDIPPNYWKTITVDEFAADGKTIINTETYLNCYPSKKNAVSHKRTESVNTMEVVEFQVERVRKT